MSGGEQQMCAIGRALMARPQLLMLDEPSMGLAPIFVEKIFEIIHEINEQGTTILLVEQNALMALDAADRGYVLETGHVALADDAKSLRENEQVRKAYLGEDCWSSVEPHASTASRCARSTEDGGEQVADACAAAGAAVGHLERRPAGRGPERSRAGARRRRRGSRRRPPSRAGRAPARSRPSRRRAAAGGTCGPSR